MYMYIGDQGDPACGLLDLCCEGLCCSTGAIKGQCVRITKTETDMSICIP